MEHKTPKVDELDLSEGEIEDGQRREKRYVWHPTEKCKKCGDRMFWSDDRLWCRSWVYMEGGCP